MSDEEECEMASSSPIRMEPIIEEPQDEVLEKFKEINVETRHDRFRPHEEIYRFRFDNSKEYNSCFRYPDVWCLKSIPFRPTD